MIIRPAHAADAPGIRRLLIAAFGGEVEADLVDRLRADDHLALALVAEDDGVSGYAGFPRLTVDDDGRTCDAAGLAPLAVLPGRQKQGIGSALIQEGHRLLAQRGCPLVFVLGDPAYYTRLGYGLAAAVPFASPYTGPHFMALRLNENAPRAGKVRYPAAFDGL